jgi:hypothetical protein
VDWNSIKTISPLLKILTKHAIEGRIIFSMGYICHCKNDWEQNGSFNYFLLQCYCDVSVTQIIYSNLNKQNSIKQVRGLIPQGMFSSDFYAR